MIVQDVNPETMLAASYEHFVAYLLYCAGAPNGEILDTPELAWGISGVPSPHLSGVVRTRLAVDADVDEVIETTLNRFRAHGMPAAWFINPDTSPVGLANKLETHGFALYDHEVAMSVDLRQVPDYVPAPDNLKISEVLDPSELRQWVGVAAISNEWTEKRTRPVFAFRAGLGLDVNLPYRSFLAYLGDTPVACGELFLGAGVAAVVWIGTIPEARRQGIAGALTLALLREARRQGYRIASLFASNEGYPVYRRLGFQEMCRIPVYFWEPEKRES